MHRLSSVFVVAVAALTGCAGEGSIAEDGRDDAFTTDGKLDGFQCTPEEAAAILKVANESTRTVLEDDVQLAAKAIDNILAFRAGDDEDTGTSDDEEFGSLAELDAVPYIGPTAFQKLLDYVHDADLVTPVDAREWSPFAMVANGTPGDFAVASDGKPVAVFKSGTGFQVRLRNGDVVDAPADAKPYPKIAVDAMGTAHLFYAADGSTSPDAWKHASYRNGQWTQHAQIVGDNLYVDNGPNGEVFALETHYVNNYEYGYSLHTVATNGDKTAETLWTGDNEVHLNVDDDGFASIAWRKGSVRTGRRTSAGWQTRDTGVTDSVQELAVTGGANAGLLIERPLYSPAFQTYRLQGSSFTEAERLRHDAIAEDTDAVVDSLGTAHFCAVYNHNVVHVQLETTGFVQMATVGGADRCKLALDKTGKVHMMTALGAVISHATLE